MALPPCTPCPPAAHPCSSLCPAQLCSLWCAGSSAIPWGRSHLAEPWDPGDVSVNTCTLVSHSALGQPCEPRCRVPSAPSWTRQVLFGRCPAAGCRWNGQGRGSRRGGGGVVGSVWRARSVPRIPELLADGCSPPALLRGIQMCGRYGYPARQRCWLSSGSISLPACVCGSARLAAQACPGADTRPGSAAAPARPCVRLPRRGAAAAALSGSVMRKM